MKSLLVSALILTGSILYAQTPAAPAGPKRIPPAGAQIAAAERAELTAGADKLAKEIASLRAALATRPKLMRLLPDVEIFHKSVDWALRYDEFMDAKQVSLAREHLQQGMARAAALRAGKHEWTTARGLVVRGYRSTIDGSVQPYGLVIPADGPLPQRVDLWCHGRGEKLTELDFIQQRQRNLGDFSPPTAIVAHPYGRFCNANKFAGEVDAFEMLSAMAMDYKIDERRVTVRGFSMGGASTWQYAMHYPGRWAAAAPGAGFAETAEFFNVFAPGKTPPPAWEQTLWRWYDATLYAANLRNLPLIAYSGELDKQKQAADIMLRFAEKEGLSFPHIIGPQTAHKYHPDSKPELEKFITAAVEKGSDPKPTKLHFTTYTLIYPQVKWLEVTALGQHWERADVSAERKGTTVELTTKNVAALRLTSPLVEADVKEAVLDGQRVAATWTARGAEFHRNGEKWTAGPAAAGGKRPGVCGPIDHAFMSRFISVRPTGQPTDAATGAWAKAELAHAATEWRRVFRGEMPVKDDTSITDADIATSNLILWGDPASNTVLRRIADKLPLKWTADKIEFAGKTYPAKSTMPVLIFPNPLNPARYIVLNSGHTFREDAAANNSNQTPKLPDWAMVDITTPADSRWPGRIVDAGFFDERWSVKP